MRTDAEIEALVRSFEDRTLPRPEWTHHAHLTVALRWRIGCWRRAAPGTISWCITRKES